MNRLKWQWQENPMLPVLVFVSAGIWSAAQACARDILITAILLIISLLAAALLRSHYLFGPAIFRTFLAWGLCWGAGAGLTVFRSEPEELPLHSAVYGAFTDCGDLQENGSRRCLARIQKIRTRQGQWEETEESAIIQVRGQAAAGFRSGHCFLLNIPLRGIPAPALPGEFNARKWYHQQGVRWQIFCPADQIILTDTLPPNLNFLAQKCRNHLEAIFFRHLTNKEDAAMLSALLLGIRKKMDPGLREAYSAAGLTHILAVSGMHVALIFGFLSFLLGFLKNLPSGRFLFAAALIALLWFYALVTGLSPSVLRAVTLFSVMQAGGVLRKPSLPLNNLCFASLILLLADETILFDLGYQLSFSAVYGIIAFQPVMAGWMQARTKTGKFIWENLCVTLAASLSTLPLILFHFHRFPLYFLISNLFAVPFSNLIIYTGIALLTASWLPLAAKFIASILHGAIALLNAFVSGINALPFSSTGNIYLSMTDFVLLLLAVVTLQLFLISKKNLHLNFLLSIVLLIFLAQLRGWCTARNQRQMFVLKHRKDWFFLETQQSHGRLSSLHPQDMPRFLEKGLKLKKMHYDTLMSRIVCRENGRESRIYSFHGKSILLLNHFLKFLPPECRLPTDFMLLEHAGEKSLLQALKFFKPMRILTDWPESRIKKFCMQNPGIPPITSLQEQKIIPIQW